MGRTLHKLKSKQAEHLGPGRHSDGGGLYLDRDDKGRSRWVFMFTRNGKRREMGLGAAMKDGVSLTEARDAAENARKALKAGLDPIEVRDEVPAEPVPVPTFGDLADAFVKSQSPQWRNEKHRAQWTSTLKTHAAALRPVPVDLIDTTAVLDVLQPIWTDKAETASRLRGRIERVLDAAKAKGHRSGENPARWRGHLDHLLPKRQKLSRGHHAALPHAKMGAFMADLRAREAVAALGLEFIILTAARSGEVLGATWDEIDLKAKVWTVPAGRMKAGREHRVPLSVKALAVLDQATALRTNDHLFPGGSRGGSLSGMAFEMLLRRMRVDATTHGFRSSFRDWAGEVSTFPRELAEAALAHMVGDATERAYRRGDALEKRREMMESWADYVGLPVTSPATT